MRTTLQRETAAEKLISKMIANPVVIDNHTGNEKTITGLVEFVADKGLACMFDARYYSLNQCYADKEGKLHCSTGSIGGVLWGGYPDAEQLKKYNDSQIFDDGKIVCCHMADGTKIYPAEEKVAAEA